MLRQPKIEVVDKSYLTALLAQKEPDRKFSRVELLTIQYTKLINYFSYDVDPKWSGVSHEREPENFQPGYSRYLEDCCAFGTDSLPHWIAKKSASLPWGPANLRLSSTASPELGYPLEPYLTLNGAILTMHQASRLLCIDADNLIRVKCSLLFDSHVVDHAMWKMLEPRPTWPRIRLKRGGKGRSYRLA